MESHKTKSPGFIVKATCKNVINTVFVSNEMIAITFIKSQSVAKGHSQYFRLLLQYLLQEFLPNFSSWKNGIDERFAKEKVSVRNKMFLAHQTFTALAMTGEQTF